MGLSKKDRRYILKNHPAMSVGDLAKALGAKASEVREVLDAFGVSADGAGSSPARPILTPGRMNLIGIMTLIATVSVVFLNSTRNGFHYDDIHSLLQNTAVMIDPHKNPGSLGLYEQYFKDPTLFSSRPGVAMPRPVLMCTFGFNYMLSAMWCDVQDGRYQSCMKRSTEANQCDREKEDARACSRGYDPRGWILLNILIHLFNVLIVYMALCHISGRTNLALLTALLFAVHPINTETVNYVNCRSESLAVFFMLLAIYFFCRSLLSEKVVKTVLFGAAFTAAYALGLLTKEMVFVTIALLAVIDVLFLFPATRDRRPLERHLIVRGVLYGIIVLAMVSYMIYRKNVLDTLVVKDAVRPFKDNLVTQSGVLLSYVRLLFLPFHQNISYENEAILHTWKGLSDPFFGSRLLFFMAMFAAGVADGVHAFIRRRPAVVALAVALFFITLSITSLVPLNALMNEHRLYLVSIGPCLMIAALLSKTSDFINQRSGRTATIWPWQTQVLALAIVLAFAALTAQRNFTWHTDLTVWRDSITKSPTKAQVVSDLGNAYFRAGGALSARGESCQDGFIDRAENLVIVQTFRRSVPEGKITPETRTVLDQLYIKGLNRAEQLYLWGIRVERSYYKAWHNLGTINFTYSTVDREAARALFADLKAAAAKAEEADTKAQAAGEQATRLEQEAQSLAEQSQTARREGRGPEADTLQAQADERSAGAAKARADVKTYQAQLDQSTQTAIKIRDEIIARYEKAEGYLNQAVIFFKNATVITASGESFNDWASCLVTLMEIDAEKARIQGQKPDEEKAYKLLKEAVENYKKAMRYNPELPKGYVNYCTNLERLARTDEEKQGAWRQCLPLLDRAIAVAPLDPRAYWIKGNFQGNLLMLNEAIQTYQQCLQVSPGYGYCQNGIDEVQKMMRGEPPRPPAPGP